MITRKFSYDETPLNRHVEKEPSALPNAGVKKPRDARLDAMRGLFLIIMAGVHVPTPLSHVCQDPVGCNGAAEGFIFLSACLAGWVYGKASLPADWTTMSRRIWKRVWQIYLVHLAVLLPIVLIAWTLASSLPPLANHFSDFLAKPWGSLALIPLLLHQPPLFDILPLYIIFLGVTPWLLKFARQRGWTMLLAVSALGWLAAQFKLDDRLIGDPARLLPLHLGAFDLLAWQFLWLCGVAIGETSLRRQIVPARWRLAVAAAASLIVLSAFVFRRGFWPQVWTNPDIFLWMDKWKVGPLRVLNAAGWVFLFLAWNPHPPKWLLAPTALLGRNSLSVFACHLPLVITAGVIVRQFAPPDAVQTAIGLLVIALLFVWAGWWEHRKRRRIAAAGTAGASTVKPPPPTTPADARTALR